MGGADESVQMRSGSVVRGSTGPGAMAQLASGNGSGERAGSKRARGGGVVALSPREAQAAGGVREVTGGS